MNATYRRAYDGRWFRNGTLIANPPQRILDMAANMARECRIEEPRP